MYKVITNMVKKDKKIFKILKILRFLSTVTIKKLDGSIKKYPKNTPIPDYIQM